MIKQLDFKAGSSEGQPSLIVEDIGPMTIFVGPNNSGKSQALREIFQFCQSGQPHFPKVIFSALSFRHRSEELASLALSRIATDPPIDTHLTETQVFIVLGAIHQPVSRPHYLEMLTNPSQNPGNFASQYLQHKIINLDGGRRLSMLNPQPIMDVRHLNSSLAKLAMESEKRRRIRNEIRDATGMYAVLDATHGQYQIRFSEQEPPDEMKLDSRDLRYYMDKAKTVEAVSDGVKAYSGILLELYIGDPEVIFIDEPEAFLHPALTAKLAKGMATLVSSQGKQIFVSTHSPHFLMGAMQSGAKINIIRLTYDGHFGTSRMLQADDLTELMQDPLLRSVGVIESLFYNAVIVCEGDSDRAFYQEINERLLDANDPRGIPHALFLNADNKQTIWRIVEPLRKLGIPCAAVVDIDILKNEGKDWSNLVSGCNFPDAEHHSYDDRRRKVQSFLNAECEKRKTPGPQGAKPPDFKTIGGIKILSDHEEIEAASNLFEDLGRYGIFVVRRGEVEDWLPELKVSRQSHLWRASIFEKMGSDPSSKDYVRPGKGDVWDFIGEINEWLSDPNRKGIPL